MHLDTSKMALESGSEIGYGIDSEAKYVAHLKSFWSQDHNNIYIYMFKKNNIHFSFNFFQIPLKDCSAAKRMNAIKP